MKKLLWIFLIFPIMCFGQTTYCNEKQCVILDKTYQPIVVERAEIIWSVISRTVPENRFMTPYQEICNKIGEQYKITYVTINYHSQSREFELNRERQEAKPIEKSEPCFSKDFIFTPTFQGN
jgi:uncharacterized protein (UPF0179 family)